MKYSIWPDTKPNQVPKNTTELHLVRPIALRKIQQLCQTRRIHTISCSASSFKRLKTKTKKWLSEHQIEVSVESKRGRPLSIALAKMLSVIEMNKDHRSFREIQQTTQVPKSTAHYLVRYAKRDKIRQNNTTVFLQ